MTNLYDNERFVLDEAKSYLESLPDGSMVDAALFRHMVEQYEHLLNQTIKITRFSDKIAEKLNEHKNMLMSQINIDELTGLYNRRYLYDVLDRYIRSDTRLGVPLSIIMLDIDFFKNYNDRYGHLEGDNCLRKVAKGITSCVKRAGDFVSRYGGEEFIVTMPNTDKVGAIEVATTILREIRNLKIPHAGNKCSEYVTISAGTTSAVPTSQSNCDVFIKTADIALYRSKTNGRNQATYLDLGGAE